MGTIVTPNESMHYEVAVTASRRLLDCHSFRDKTVDATRFFRGRTSAQARMSESSGPLSLAAVESKGTSVAQPPPTGA